MNIIKATRQAMKELNLSRCDIEARPSYPNAYRYAPPGKTFEAIILERKGEAGRIMKRKVTAVSCDKRSGGDTSYIVYGIPAAKNHTDNPAMVAAIKKAKDRIKDCGYTPMAGNHVK